MDENAAHARVARQRQRLSTLAFGSEAYRIASLALRILEDDAKAFAETQKVLDASWEKIRREPGTD